MKPTALPLVRIRIGQKDKDLIHQALYKQR